jgi:hypothetical protein
MRVKRWRKKAEDRSVWAIVLKEALAKLQGLYAKEEEILPTCLNTRRINKF